LNPKDAVIHSKDFIVSYMIDFKLYIIIILFVNRDKAILDYLSGLGPDFEESFSTFQQASDLADYIPEGNGFNLFEYVYNNIGKGMLARKWTSIIRLQKKVMELEAKVERLEGQNSSLSSF